jgi:V8-like Glu-specific endopeptidase
MTLIPAASRILVVAGLTGTIALQMVGCTNYGFGNKATSPNPATQPTCGSALTDQDQDQDKQAAPSQAAASANSIPANALAVYDGQAIPASQYPYVGVVAFRNSQIEGLCSGSLVCPNVVMTAAHCFSGADLGPSNYAFSLSTAISFTGSASDQLPPDAVGAIDIKINPAYAGADPKVTRAPDMAFLHLAKGFNVQMAQLQLSPIDVATDTTNLPKANVVGYGESDLGGGGSGSKRAGNAFLVGSLAGDAGTIVTIPDSNNQDTCEGDSGGPLLIGGAVYGVLSGGDAATCGAGAGTSPRGYYASVPSNKAFIQSVIDDWCGPAALAAVTAAPQSEDALPTAAAPASAFEPAPCQATAP